MVLQIPCDKMNCTVRFGKQFSESSPCLPGHQGTGQQGWYANGTLRNQFTKLTVQFILGRSIEVIGCANLSNKAHGISLIYMTCYRETHQDCMRLG